MIADKFSLDKYILKKKFPSKVIISSESGEFLFQAVKPFVKNILSIFDSQSSNVPALDISWKIKSGLMAIGYNYVITDRSHAPLAYLEGEKQPISWINFIIKDIFKQEIGRVQSESISDRLTHIDIVVRNKKIASFYSAASTFRLSRVSGPYIMDFSGDKQKMLDRRIGVSIGVILAGYNLALVKSSGSIDWDKPVATGDDIYKIKQRRV
ncbi:hypothetical protein ACFL1E_00580 [Candidatus Omnitrophota bacterium]